MAKYVWYSRSTAKKNPIMIVNEYNNLLSNKNSEINQIRDGINNTIIQFVFPKDSVTIEEKKKDIPDEIRFWDTLNISVKAVNIRFIAKHNEHNNYELSDEFETLTTLITIPDKIKEAIERIKKLETIANDILAERDAFIKKYLPNR